MAAAAEGTVLVTGAAGQVGRALLAAGQARRRIVGVDRSALDVGDAAEVDRVLGRIGPAVVVNCAAYTAVDRAEAEPDAAFRINAEAPGILARWCKAHGAPLVHISTDYVFSGEGERPWQEDDPVAPLSVYGASKAAGEAAVREAGGQHVIVRTSWVFAPWGHNFVRTMLRLAESRAELSVVDDQWGRPTAAADIAGAVLAIIDRAGTSAPAFGTFHFANAGPTTWRRFAEAVFDLAGPRLRQRPRVLAVPTEAYPTPARRPANSRLDTARYEQVFGRQPRPWRDALAEVLDELYPPSTIQTASEGL